MTILGLHWIDFAIVIGYFVIILYIGVFQGAKRTKTLGDFFVAGGKWGPLASFIFIFASAIGGNEAVVVGGQAYRTGLSGVWYWWSFLFATPVYFAFATHFRRGRVYNLAEFLEMRYGARLAATFSVIGGVVCILFAGMGVLAIGKIVAGLTTLSVEQSIALISLIVGAYVFSGGMMSALLTDLLQGLMCLFILSFVMLPFLWMEVGGMASLRTLPPSTWDLAGEGMTLWTVLALNASALVGGVAAPWIYNWIAVSRDERAATQCGWGHLWKRVITLLFALYGILFAIYDPGLADGELAWGQVMGQLLPVGLLGLLVASFFAAAMSSADAWATTSSAMHVDYLYRKVLRRGRSLRHYLRASRVWAAASIGLAALCALQVETIRDILNMSMSLLGFLGLPIYFGVYWRRANRLGMWLSLTLGMGAYVTIMLLMTGTGRTFPDSASAFPWGVFVSTSLALVGMVAGSIWGRPEDALRVKRFHVILSTPVGSEHRLVDAGIRLPAMVDAGLVPEGPEVLRPDVVESLFAEYSRDKVFGAESTVELRREPTLPWYFGGLARITLACAALVLGTWLITRVLFIW